MKIKNILKITTAIILVASIIVFVVFFRGYLDDTKLEQWILSMGIFAPVIFFILCSVGPVFFLPGAMLTMLGGAIFGPIEGALYSLCGATVGASVAFLIARHLAADWVERKVKGRLRRLSDGVEREGWRFVAFVRLVPLFPFNLLNYALGLTRINFFHYFFASLIFMGPGAFAYAYFGYAGREMIKGGGDVVRVVTIASIVLALLLTLPLLIKRYRRSAPLGTSRPDRVSDEK